MKRINRDLFNELKERAINVLTVEDKGEILYPDGKEIITRALENFITNAFIDTFKIGSHQMVGDLLIAPISISYLREEIESIIEKQNIDLNYYWSKDRPVINRIKGVVSRICEGLGINIKTKETTDRISHLLETVRQMYAPIGTWTFQVHDIGVFNEIAVSDGDEKACFRQGGCHRADYHTMASTNRVYYLLYQSPNNEYGRCWLWDISDELIFCINFYGIESDKRLNYAMTRALRLYKGWSSAIYRFGELSLLPIYTNNNQALFIYKDKNAMPDVYDKLEKVEARCGECGKYFPITKLRYHDDSREILCEDCYDDEDYEVCYDCGDRVDTDEAHWVDDRAYCNSCFHDHYFYCDGCDETYSLDYGYTVEDYIYCEDCFFDRYTYCENCSEPVPNDSVYTADDTPYCEDCYRELFIQCDKCGEPVPREDIYEIGDSYYCKECYKERIDEREVANG